MFPTRDSSGSRIGEGKGRLPSRPVFAQDACSMIAAGNTYSMHRGDVMERSLVKPSKFGLSALALFALLGCAPAAFAQNGSVPLRLTLVSGSGQQTVVGAQLGQPFVMKATDIDGAPVAGLTVGFEVNSCDFQPGWNTCPPVSVYGSFDGSADASAITDAAGIATSPLLTAGSTAGTYSTFGWVASQVVGGTYYRFDSNTGLPTFDITQIVGGSAAVSAPDIGVVAKLFAGLLLAFAATRHLRRNAITR
jgi:hypothetical protein